MIPCKDCLVLPACRHKRYRQLIHECEALHKTLYHTRGIKRKHNFSGLIIELDKVMNRKFKMILLGVRDDSL